jgi:hypothetical protein
MGCPKDALADNQDPLSAEDNLGRLIRWGLEDSLSTAEPSARVWTRVLARVRELEAAPAPKRSLKRLLPLAPLAQAVVVSAILLAFGLGVDRELVTSGSYPQRATPAVRSSQVQVESADGMLRGYMLFRRQPDPLAQKARRLAEANQLK